MGDVTTSVPNKVLQGAKPSTTDEQDGVVLHVRDLRTHYLTPRGAVRAVDGVTFILRQGERLGLVGESGCGKSTLVMSLLRLVPAPGRVVGGQMLLGKRSSANPTVDLAALSNKEMDKVRWQRISLIPQGAMNSLNPVMRVYSQVADGIQTHEGKWSEQRMTERIQELFGTVGLPPRVMHLFPHELSGGMKQRVCIAMAIALNPQLIIADEPTSALDVVVQRLVMQTVVEVQEEIQSSLILVGHDMGLQAQVVHRLCVMYAGRIAEIGLVDDMFGHPLHPYTRALVRAVPSVREKKAPTSLPGLPPQLLDPPPGCLFHPRCSHAQEVCREVVPEMLDVGTDHQVACHLYS